MYIKSKNKPPSTLISTEKKHPQRKTTNMMVNVLIMNVYKTRFVKKCYHVLRCKLIDILLSFRRNKSIIEDIHFLSVHLPNHWY